MIIFVWTDDPTQLFIIIYWLINCEKKQKFEVWILRVQRKSVLLLWQRQHRHQQQDNTIHTIVEIIKVIYADTINGWSQTHPRRPHSRILWTQLPPLLVIIQTNKWLMHCQHLNQIFNWTILVCLPFIILSKISLGKFLFPFPISIHNNDLLFSLILCFS